MLGYAGKVLHVNLTTASSHVKKLDEATAKKYIGGIGLGMKLYWSNSKVGVDPLSSENPFVLAVGPISGTMFPTGGSGHAFVSKSPVTNLLGTSVSRGTFGAEFKRAGYDAVVITGKAEKPSYLWIDDDSIQILDASALWGKSPEEVEDAIRVEIGDFYVRVASIGVAGENLSKIACIVNDRTRVAGRTGLGAVMGSKNLKAIAVRGTMDVSVSKPDEFFSLVKDFHERMKGPAVQKYRTMGSTENLVHLNDMFCVPTRNYNDSHFQLAENIGSSVINERFVVKIIGCNSCAMRCEHEVLVREGIYKDTLTRIEYDSLWAFGPNLGVDRLDVIIKAIERCTYYGLDTQSVGGVIGFIMDCHGKGLLKNNSAAVLLEELGFVPYFGNADVIIPLIEHMAVREGIGDILADGVKVAAEKLGSDGDDVDAFGSLAQHVKGLEATGYDLRCLKTTALSVAVSFRGADHSRSGAFMLDLSGKVDRLKAEVGRGKLVEELEDIYNLIDSFIICKNAKGTLYKDVEDLAKLYSAVTGKEITSEELKLAGQRIETLARLINIREGLTRKDDTLPWKVLNQPITDNNCPTKGQIVTQEELNLMLDDYYTARGWTLKGTPTKKTLQQLELHELKNITITTKKEEG
ncbi:MAG: aldehyde ferredoxin oxidoreductase family protein [Nitrososphaerota archaeon]|nr:aldehyde ferredoxin oxidoreductase family protein [Nitrososphaerota archaeon]